MTDPTNTRRPLLENRKINPSPFRVDTDLKDVVIQPAPNGLHIKLKGAVQRYRSDLYLEDGDTYTTYRVSLEQVETRPPLPSGR